MLYFDFFFLENPDVIQYLTISDYFKLLKSIHDLKFTYLFKYFCKYYVLLDDIHVNEHITWIFVHDVTFYDLNVSLYNFMIKVMKLDEKFTAEFIVKNFFILKRDM